MTQTPDEKTYVEIPFIEQLKGMDWDHIAGDIDVPYLPVHELVHLIEHGHTDRFWGMVARVMPEYEEHARWLNENGADLDL